MDPVTALLMQSVPGPSLSAQDMSDSEEDIMPARARAMEADDDDDDEAKGGRGGKDFESDESDSDAVADGDEDADEEDDDEDDDEEDADDSEEDSGSETDMDASDEDDEEDDSDDSDEDDEDSTDEKKKKPVSQTKKKKKPVVLANVVPSLKFLKRNLKSVKLFMEAVDAHMRKTECTLYKAVDDVKKQADMEDLYSSICLLNEKVDNFTQQVVAKMGSDDRPGLAHAAHTLMSECVVLVEPQYAPSLFVSAIDKPCAVSGKATTMRLSVFKDTFKTYIEERTAAKERGDPKPTYNNDAVPKRLAVPVTPNAAPLLVQFVVAGSVRQLYNPALKRLNLNVYAAAAHDAMRDIARFV